MFSNIKNKVLSLSGSYTFYKNNYIKISEENKKLKEENTKLKKENNHLKYEKENYFNKILFNQSELNNYLNILKEDNLKINNKLLLKQEQESEMMNKLSENTTKIISTQDTTLSYLNNFKDETLIANKNITTNINELPLKISKNKIFDDLLKENEKIINVILSNQEYFTKKLNRNYDVLSNVEMLGLKVEKSSAYTNIKLDSKFDDYIRLMSEFSDDLLKNIQSIFD